MTKKEFVDKFLPFAKQTETKSGISAVAILTQAALESGWGQSTPGNMFFGVKDNDGINGNEQLLTTTEYSTRANLVFPVIISITPVVMGGKRMFKYKVKDYFRKYKTPEGSFTDHADFFKRNPRYSKALLVKHDYNAFFDAIALAGYATAPNYAAVLKQTAKDIVKYIK